MFDPDVFRERSLHMKVADWLYAHEFTEWRDHRLQLTDKAAGYCMVAMTLLIVCLAV